jgi:ABC-type polysaccharide/polyol phosphate transport system ATPase subunit
VTHAIEVEHLTKRYRIRGEGGRTVKELVLGQYPPGSEVTALDDVSFRVDRGETLGVIGANGSGKSTLLKVLAGTSRPTSGRADVQGRTSALLEIGAGFHPDFSGRENAYLNGSLLGLSRKELDAAMPRIQEFADLGRFFDAPVKTYSSGMYARLGFAVAIHVEPDVLLVDEVLAVGDEYFQHKCFARINAIRAAGKTILFVSHDLAAVRRICGRALFLNAGRIAAEGDVAYAIEAYEETVRSKEGRELAAAERTAQRWGTREVEITGVRLHDAAGADARVLRSGDPVTIELSYRATRAFDEVTFGVAFYRDDGAACYGTNTTLDGVHLAVAAGEGTVCFRAPRLELLEGQYVLDVAAVSPDYADTYDFHSKAYPFRVYGSTGEIGLVRIAHEWEHARGG